MIAGGCCGGTGDQAVCDLGYELNCESEIRTGRAIVVSGDCKGMLSRSESADTVH